MNERAQSSQRFFRAQALWVVVYLFAAVFIFLRFRGFAFDDAYIIFRVARNLASGQGWVYNLGERVNAVSDPLYTIILAGLYFITRIDLPVLGAAVSVAGFFAAATLLAFLVNAAGSSGGRPGTTGGGLAGLLVLASPLLISCMGMETGLLLALGTGALWAYSQERWRLCGALFGLAILARPDAAVLAGVVFLHFVISRGKTPWRALIWFFLVLAPWFIFSGIYFGELLPHTLAVKTAQAHAGAQWGGEWMFAQSLYVVLAKFFGEFEVGFILVALCVGFGLAAALRMSAPWPRIILAWAVLHAGAYALVLRVPPYTWYFAPVVVGLLLLLGLGAAYLAALAAEVRLLRESLIAITAVALLVWAATAATGLVPSALATGLVVSAARRFSPVHTWHALGYLALVLSYRLLASKRLPPARGPGRRRNWRISAAALLLAGAAFIPRHYNGWLQMTHLPTSQYAYYHAAAEWISANRPRARTVGAHEIGVLGYFLPGQTIIDQAGIPTPGAALHLAQGDVTWWIRRYRPALLILHPAQDWWHAVEGPILSAPWFEKAYQAAALISGRYETGKISVVSGARVHDILQRAGLLRGAENKAKPGSAGLSARAGAGFDKHAVMIWELARPDKLPAPE